MAMHMGRIIDGGPGREGAVSDGRDCGAIVHVCKKGRRLPAAAASRT